MWYEWKCYVRATFWSACGLLPTELQVTLEVHVGECRCCPAQVYGMIWAVVSVAFMGGGILAGIYFFK